jgi:hypothetical protein
LSWFICFPDTKKRTRDKEPVVVQKGNWTKKKKPNLFRDINLPDELEGFDFLFEKTSGKVVSRSSKTMLGPNNIHPAFKLKFDDKLHGTEFRKRLKFHPDANKEGVQRITELVKEYWCCFCKANVPIPIKDYECHIDTGTAKPTVAKGIRFGFHERPIMQDAIDALLQKDQIVPDTTSEWLSKPVLAPKPHQEEITGDKIDDFVWRFCISFIALNQVTKLISYPIPRCDDAVMIGIGKAKFRISMDAFSGYHQIAMEHASSLKTAFAGPHGRKYRYKVMPFGLVNGPVIFVIMVYDLKNHWDTLAQSWNLNINDETNSIIIIDDTFIYSNSLDSIIEYLRAILEISKRYNLSWKLEKCGFLDPRFEFVGVDVADIGNYPAKSKEPISLMWKDKKPVSVRDLASFIGFVGYYRDWIPYFEERLRHTRSVIAGHDYNYNLTSKDCPEKIHQEMNDILDALLSDPVLRRPDPKKRFYLRTDASKHGHGNVLLQPGDDKESLLSMNNEIKGHKCEFDISTKSKLRLYPIGFSGRKCSTSESFLHSFMNEALAVNFGIDKWRIFLWGKEFTVLTDCRALIWLLSYEGTNAAVRRLQFEILGYWFTICHRSAAANADTDGLSRLALDFSIDPSLQDYYKIAADLDSRFPCVQGEIQPNNLPGFRRNSRKKKEQLYSSAHHLLSKSTRQASYSIPYIRNIPVSIVSTYSVNQISHSDTSCCTSLHHQPLISTALQSSTFNWVVNKFGSGAFFSVCNTLRIPFTIPLASDTTFKGRSLLHEFGRAHTIVEGSYELLQAIRNTTLKFHGYFVTAPWSISDKEEKLFFDTQASIIHHLQIRCQLSIFMMHVHLDIHSNSIDAFMKKMTSQHWIINKQLFHFPSFNDSIDDSALFLIAINSNQVGPQFHHKIIIQTPPQTQDVNLRHHILEEYNLERYAFLECPELIEEPLVNDTFQLSPTKAAETHNRQKARITHYLRYTLNTSSSIIGTKICDTNYPCIPLEDNNINPFKNLFGIRFQDNNKTWIRSISHFELASCFGLDRQLKLKLSEDKELFILLFKGCPANTMKSIITEIYHRLLDIRNESLVIDDFSQHDPPTSHHQSITAPAATAFHILNGSVCMKLPTKEQWMLAYQSDKSCQSILEMLDNPGLINKHRLNSIHYRYRQPLRSGSIISEDGFLVLKESIDSRGFVKLRIVPEQLWNVIFLAFHSNPIGGHFSVYYTFHRIRLRFFWPRMYQYIRQMCKLCAACSLSNSTHQKSKELLYSFPIDAPFKLVVADIYKAGEIAAFQGEKGLFILLDHMTGFVIIEELLGLNSTIFSRVIMKILLQHGFCHTIIVDADSKFKGIFKETMQLLQLNVHWASGNNHDSILVERFNAYLNKGLKILCTERSTTRSFVESAQLLAYAWNSAPMAETDISRSLVAVGREFAFPIDYLDAPAPSLDVDASIKQQYHENLRSLLKSCRDVYKVLIEEHRCMHREYVNARRPDPIIFKINDIVWNRRQIQSNSKRGIVGKLRFKQTGPWKIIEKLSGGSYKLQLQSNPTRTDKKHASELSLFPHKLIPFPQLAGTDNAYSKLHKDFNTDPYSEAGLKGYDEYNLAQTWQLQNPQMSFAKHLPRTHYTVDPFPTLQELNDEMKPQLNNNHHGNMELANPSLPSINYQNSASVNNLVVPDQPTTINEVDKQAETQVQINLPATAAELMANVIANEDKLCFIRHHIPSLHRYEWRLIKIELSDSIQKNPTTLATGRVLVTFYIAHPSDAAFNAPNQRFWKQYHFDDNNLVLSHRYHLVRPNKNEHEYCRRKNLKPYQEWINLHDKDTFLLGPFNFASINNRKTNDRISATIWKQLHSLECRVSNSLPTMDINIQGYVCHIDTPFHSEHQSPSISASINTVLSQRYFDN